MPEPVPSPRGGSSGSSGGTVKVLGKRYPKSVVYAGGAAVLGIFVYAWWTRGGGSGEDEEEPIFDEFGNPIAGPTPGLGAPTVIDSNLEVVPDNLPRNNAEWGQKATEFLTNQGYEGIVVAPALGKFIARKPLNTAEAAIVRAAIAGVGYPPHDGPWTVIEEQSPIAVGLIAPKNLRVTKVTDKTISVAWDAVPGATSYGVEEVQGVNTVRRSATVSGTTYTTPANLAPNSQYRIDVRAKNGSATGDESRIVARTATAAAITRITAAPKVRVVNTTRTSVHYRWDPVPGASGYIIEAIEGLNTVKFSRLISAREFVWQGLRPAHSYRLRVRGAQSKSNVGPAGSATGRTKS